MMAFGASAQESPRDRGYQYAVRLADVNNDELNVELLVPEGATKESKIRFHLPSIIPGTYKIHNYGRFIQVFSAFDKKGNRLKVNRPEVNTWEISDADKLYRITYFVEDTWDSYQNNPIFEPSGTCIEKNSLYLVNPCGFFGWLEGLEKLPFYVSIEKPSEFYGATSLKRLRGSADMDVFRATNYHELIDNPILYTVPDTTVFYVGDARIEISLYTKTARLRSKYIAEQLSPLLQIIKVYLGGRLPVNRYSFLVIANDKPFLSRSYGALEHSMSCMIVLPDEDPNRFYRNVRDIAAHEFFHIVTPLNIHSKEIANFDYLNPKMSKHLWLYEGCVEYMSLHVQARYGLLPLSNYFDALAGKIRFSQIFDQSIPFTELSKRVLEDGYRREYMNVYQKGALIGMCLDLLLLKKSKGQYGLVSLLNDLARAYGPSAPFDDDVLFDKIESISTYREVGSFLRACVADTAALPMQELLLSAGISYMAKGCKKEISPLCGLENGALKSDGENRLYIDKFDRMDEFGKKDMGFQKGDVLKSWNGVEIDAKTGHNNILRWAQLAKEGDPLEVVVLRHGTPVTLKANLRPVTVQAEHIFELQKPIDENQRVVRQAWIGVSG